MGQKGRVLARAGARLCISPYVVKTLPPFIPGARGMPGREPLAPGLPAGLEKASLRGYKSLPLPGFGVRAA